MNNLNTALQLQTEYGWTTGPNPNITSPLPRKILDLPLIICFDRNILNKIYFLSLKYLDRRFSSQTEMSLVTGHLILNIKDVYVSNFFGEYLSNIVRQYIQNLKMIIIKNEIMKGVDQHSH